MNRIWLVPAGIALAMIVVRPLSGIDIGPVSGSTIHTILVGILLITALILSPRNSADNCDDNSQT